MTLLTVSKISKNIGRDFVLSDISFSQKRFQKIAIAGETGSGKSTLLKIIAGLIQADSGEVRFENEKVKGPVETLVPGHPSIAYLSQHFELPHSLRVEQVLEYANILSHEQANAIYNVCQISHLMSRRTDQLSGGERQRIALAKLLIASPKLLLLDEPYSNLDKVHQNTLEDIIRDIGRKLKITCILVSHDPVDTLSWADKIYVMMLKMVGTEKNEKGWKSNRYKCRRCNIEFTWNLPNNPWDMLLHINEVLQVMRLKYGDLSTDSAEKEQIALMIKNMEANLEKLKPVIDAHNQEYEALQTRETEMEKLVHEFKNSLLIEKIKMDTWENKKK